MAENHEFELVHFPQLGLFNQQRFAHPFFSLNWKLIRGEAKNARRRTTDNNRNKILITSFTFWIRKVTVHLVSSQPILIFGQTHD